MALVQVPSHAAVQDTVIVRLFARLADIGGVHNVELDICEGLTIHDAYLQICHRFPELIEYDGKLLYARNSEYVSPTAVLRPGDELVLIPPVSGG